ncbi:hypothetical protein EDC33_0546 [Salinicoccus roseus]|jgi:hypothetical protein|nr:hypothetical protein EDC33_0546 [Salinicoccus roseus]
MLFLMIISIIITVVIGFLIYKDTETEDNEIIE